MVPRRHFGYDRPYGGKWNWLYHQPTVLLRGQSDLLVRLMVAEVKNMELLQMMVLSWGAKTNMQEHPDWMSVRWVKNVLKSLEWGGILGRRMQSFESVEAEVCTFRSNHIFLDGAIWIARLVSAKGPMTPSPSHSLKMSSKPDYCLNRKR